MKTNLIYRFSILALTASALIFTQSCSHDNDEPTKPDTPGNEGNEDYDDIEILTVADANFVFNNDGIWNNNDKARTVVIDDYVFSHATPYPNYVNGFTPSKSTDLAYYPGDMFNHPYTSIAGGLSENAPYLVGFWDAYTESQAESNDLASKSCSIREKDGDTFMPQSVMVTNNTYAYYAMTKGDSFTSAFNKGSWFRLIAHGVQTDGSEKTAEFYLAKVDTDNVENGILSEWKEFNLTPLGIVTGIYFTLESSDSGEWGMNTPAYFCLDRLIVKD